MFSSQTKMSSHHVWSQRKMSQAADQANVYVPVEESGRDITFDVRPTGLELQLFQTEQDSQQWR